MEDIEIPIINESNETPTKKTIASSMFWVFFLMEDLSMKEALNRLVSIYSDYLQFTKVELRKRSMEFDVQLSIWHVDYWFLLYQLS